MLIFLLIYFIFYLIKNSNYIFSEDVINKTREFLSYDINFQNLYYQAQDYYNNNLKVIVDNENEETNEITNEIANEQIENQIQENVKSTIEALSGIIVDAVNIHIQGIDYSEDCETKSESESDAE